MSWNGAYSPFEVMVKLREDILIRSGRKGYNRNILGGKETITGRTKAMAFYYMDDNFSFVYTTVRI